MFCWSIQWYFGTVKNNVSKLFKEYLITKILTVFSVLNHIIFSPKFLPTRSPIFVDRWRWDLTFVYRQHNHSGHNWHAICNTPGLHVLVSKSVYRNKRRALHRTTLLLISHSISSKEGFRAHYSNSHVPIVASMGQIKSKSSLSKSWNNFPWSTWSNALNASTAHANTFEPFGT